MNNKKKSNAVRHFAKVQVESQGKGKNQFQKRLIFMQKVMKMTLEEVSDALLKYTFPRFKFHNAVLMEKLEQLTKTNSD